jgi:hypothetical protein
MTNIIRAERTSVKFCEGVETELLKLFSENMTDSFI